MSCGCTSPCSCDECDANNEPLASALNNFITVFFGTISKTCVDNQVQWILPCDLEEGLPGSLARREGEGIACYLLRLIQYVASTSDPTPNGCSDFYNKIAINGLCYDTWQAAYDANVGVTTPTLMLVGQGTTFGGLVLAANYNSNIIPSGFGAAVSQLGSITGNGFTINITSYDLTFV